MRAGGFGFDRQFGFSGQEPRDAAALTGLNLVGSITQSIDGSIATNTTVSLTALTGGIGAAAAIGDIVICAYSVVSASDIALTIDDGSTNYTLVGTERYAGNPNVLYTSNLRVAYKVLSAADATVRVGPTSNVAFAGSVMVQVWRGINATPLDVAAVGAGTTGTGLPNPGAITPVTAGAVILAIGCMANDASPSALTNSGDLVNVITRVGVDTAFVNALMGSKAWTSGAFDPATFTGGSTYDGGWCGMTLALRPA